MRILVISAHCADFCSRAGGTIARHVRHGDQVKVVALTYGERSESGGLYAGGRRPSLEEVKAIRRDEAEAAAATLGAEIAFWDWADLRFEYTQERALLISEEIRRYAPHVLLTHHGPDPVSVDHDTTARLAQRANQLAGAVGLESTYPPTGGAALYMFEATVPLTELEGFNPDVYVDITEVWDLKIKALDCFKRAQGNLMQMYIDQGRLRGFQARSLGGRGVQYAEAFERTRPSVGSYLPE